MPRVAKTPCPYRRLSNGEWVQESLQFVPLSFDFILPGIHAKPGLWLGEKRYLHTLRRLAYEGDVDSVRTLSQLQGSDEHKNTELQELIRHGMAHRLAKAIEYCDQCRNKNKNAMTKIKNLENKHKISKHAHKNPNEQFRLLEIKGI